MKIRSVGERNKKAKGKEEKSKKKWRWRSRKITGRVTRGRHRG